MSNCIYVKTAPRHSRIGFPLIAGPIPFPSFFVGTTNLVAAKIARKIIQIKEKSWPKPVDDWFLQIFHARIDDGRRSYTWPPFCRTISARRWEYRWIFPYDVESNPPVTFLLSPVNELLFFFPLQRGLCTITHAKRIKYEAGNGTPEANGTSEPIRNWRSKNGTRQYTWCIDRFDCFPLKPREQPPLFSFPENFSVLSIPWYFILRPVRGYNRARYRSGLRRNKK